MKKSEENENVLFLGESDIETHHREFKHYPDVLTVKKTAELLSVCPNSIYKLIQHKQLPCCRIGSAIRISKKDVMSFMERYN